MKKLNAAVIGCGVWGRNHARVYRELPDVELKAVADANPKTSEEIGYLYQAKSYTDPFELIKDPEIKLVSVCTPTITHAEIALAAIGQGKHVLVEKPMTNTVKEAQTLIAAAEKNRVLLTVGFVERFNPAVQEAIKRVADGEIGDIILAHTRRVSRSPGRIGDVGVIKDLAIHDIDIVNHLFKGDPESVYAIAGRIAHRYEDYANINIRYKGDRTAFVETNWLTPRRKRTLTITGTEGIINIEYTTQEISIETHQQVTQPILPYQEPLYLELKNFVDSVINDTPPQVTGEDGLKALRICEAALSSAKIGRRVEL